MPELFHTIRICEEGLREFMFRQLAVLVSIVKQVQSNEDDRLSAIPFFVTCSLVIVLFDCLDSIYANAYLICSN